MNFAIPHVLCLLISILISLYTDSSFPNPPGNLLVFEGYSKAFPKYLEKRDGRHSEVTGQIPQFSGAGLILLTGFYPLTWDVIFAMVLTSLKPYHLELLTL